jgi:20S proteasome alpha/beta subunit
VRPFGVTSMVGVYDKNGPHLYMLEPSGVYWVFHSDLNLKIYNFNLVGL